MNLVDWRREMMEPTVDILSRAFAQNPRQGTGIGRRMMDVYCAMLDKKTAVGFLENDKPENVRFYRKFAFEVVNDVDVIGIKTYFLRRKSFTITSG